MLLHAQEAPFSATRNQRTRSSQHVPALGQHRWAMCHRRQAAAAAAAAAVLQSEPSSWSQQGHTRMPPQQPQHPQQGKHSAALQLEQQLQQLHQRVSHGQQQAATRRLTTRCAAADAALTVQLKAAADWRQLVLLVRQQTRTSSSSSQAASLQQTVLPVSVKPKRSQRRQLQHQEQQELEQPEQVQAGLHQLNTLHLSCILSSLAKQQQSLGLPQPLVQPAALGHFTALVFSEVQRQLPQVAPRELSNLLWAAAKLEQPPAPQQLRAVLAQLATPAVLQGANAQDLSMALYAAAVLGLQVPDTQLQSLLQAFAAQLQGASPQAIANTLWAVAMLQYRPQEQWLQGLEQQCCVLLQQQQQNSQQQQRPGQARQHQQGFTSKGLHQVLWSLARMQWMPQPQFQQLFWAVSAAELPGMSPHGTSGLLWSAATLALPPPRPWLTAWYSVTCRQLQEGRFGAQDVANAMWGLVRLRQQPEGSWLAAAMAASRAVLHGAGSQELSNMLWAWARLGQRPEPSWMSCWLQAMLARMSSYCAPALASSAYALALLRYRPPAGWCETLLCESQRQMAAFGAQELSNLVWALAVLGLRPSRQWLQDFQMQSLSGSRSFNGQELSVVCWSLARLGCRPPAAWVAQLLTDGLEAHGGLSVQSLAMLMWALVRWRLPEVWEGGQHRVLLPRYWAAAEKVLPGASLTQLSLILWARANLGSSPSLEWHQSFWAAVEPALLAATGSSSSSRRELATASPEAQQQQQQQPHPRRHDSRNQHWTTTDVVRLIWATGQLPGLLPDSRSHMLLGAAQAVLPGCSFGALTAVGMSLVRIHRREQAAAAGALLSSGSCISDMSQQQAASFWQAWFACSTLLLQQQQSGACGSPLQQQGQMRPNHPKQQQQEQQQQGGISARDLSAQLNTVWQLRLWVPEQWRAAAARAVPGVLPAASLDQVSWIMCAAVKLKLYHQLPIGWAGLALQRCLLHDLQAAAAHGAAGTRQRTVRKGLPVQGAAPGSLLGPAVRRLGRAFRVLQERGMLSPRELQLWLQLEARWRHIAPSLESDQ